LSREQWARFRDLVIADPSLQADLQRHTELPPFIADIVRLAATHGLVVDETDVQDALNAARRSWLERWI
jgi:hypothetical protein